MKGLINLESIWRRSLKSMGLYHQWMFFREKHMPTKQMRHMRDLYGGFISSGSLCFDIGANMGSRVSAFLALKAKVVAVEPQEVCVRELRKVFAGEPVTIVQKGVGASNTVKQFYIASNSLVSSFNTEWIDGMKQKLKDRWDKVVEMEIVTLDSLIDEYGMPDFIKIDTEGFEMEVLKGLSHAVKSLSFEYTLPEPVGKTRSCIEYVDQLYGGKASFNICRDEAYHMLYPAWKTSNELIQLIEGASFNSDNFGNYGDVYVKM